MLGFTVGTALLIAGVLHYRQALDLKQASEKVSQKIERSGPQMVVAADQQSVEVIMDGKT